MQGSRTDNPWVACPAQNGSCPGLRAVALACLAGGDLGATLQRVAQAVSASCSGASCQIWSIDRGKGEAALLASVEPAIESLGRIRVALAQAGDAADGAAFLPQSIVEAESYPPQLAAGPPRLLRPLAAGGKIVGLLALADSEDEPAPCLGFAGCVADIIGPTIGWRSELQAVPQRAIVQEMHHRVKNNLQTIASLLRLQLRHSESEAAERALQESISRIQSIAAVHEILAGENMGVVSMREVVRTLLRETHQMASSPQRRISTAVLGTDVLLPARAATTVAVVLSELIQNAITHGIGDRPAGRIEVRLQDAGDRIIFTVANDGQPPPDGFSIADTTSLGLQIVNTLVRGDLQGTFTLTRDRLTTATVDFPRPPDVGGISNPDHP